MSESVLERLGGLEAYVWCLEPSGSLPGNVLERRESALEASWNRPGGVLGASGGRLEGVLGLLGPPKRRPGSSSERLRETMAKSKPFESFSMYLLCISGSTKITFLLKKY